MAGLNLFTNNAATTLASGINNSVTSLTVATGAGALFPNPTAGQYFYCTLANTAGTVEIVKVTARSTDTFTIVRGQDNTSATSWSAGDKVELRLTAADLNNFGQLDSTNTWAGQQTMNITGNVTGNADTATTAGTLSSTLAVNKGGTGQTSYTDGQLLIGNSTGNTLAKGTLTAGTGISVTNGPGAVITIASTVTSGQIQTQLFTAPGTWTCPASTTQVRVTVIGGGGGGGPVPGFYGGVAVANVPVSGPVSITVAAAVGGSTNGNTSSFGSAVSSTGGTSGAVPAITRSPGIGTVSIGTALKVSYVTSSAYSIITGNLNLSTSPGGVTYSTSTVTQAGVEGSAGSTIGGVSGAVAVEWVS